MGIFRYSVAGTGIFVAAFILVPVVSILLKSMEGSSWDAFSNPQVMEAMRLSFFTASISTLIIVFAGTLVAYYLSRSSSPHGRFLGIALNLPMVLPPAVAGIALLAAFGREGILGGHLFQLGITLPFTTVAVIMAQTFVALPLYVRSLKAGFDGVDKNLESASCILGASNFTTFLKVSIPLSMTPLLAGVVLSWARALGEFGATIMFAGNFVGKTQTMPLAVYSALQSDIFSALALSSLLVVVSLIILIAFEVIAGRWGAASA